MRAATAILGAALLAACSGPVTEDDLRYDSLRTETRRAYAAAYLDQPFAEGAIRIVAEENGEMATFTLVPCRGGDFACAGGLHGRAGAMTMGPDYVTVSGAYAGRTFFLAPGGRGVLRRHGVDTPLAWD